MFASLFLAAVLAVFLTLGAVRGRRRTGSAAAARRPTARAEPSSCSGGSSARRRSASSTSSRCTRSRSHRSRRRWLTGPTTSWAGARAGGGGDRHRRAVAARVGVPVGDGERDRDVHAVRSRDRRRTARHDRRRTQRTHGSDVAHIMSLALPFEGLYQAGLHALGSNESGLTGVLVNLGPFGSSHAGGIGLDLWAVAVHLHRRVDRDRRHVSSRSLSAGLPSARSTSTGESGRRDRRR